MGAFFGAFFGPFFGAFFPPDREELKALSSAFLASKVEARNGPNPTKQSPSAVWEGRTGGGVIEGGCERVCVMSGCERG